MSDFKEHVIYQWLDHRLSAEARGWLEGVLLQAPSFDPVQLERSLALAGRRIGKRRLDLSSIERAEAGLMRPGWNPRDWTEADAARALILLVPKMSAEIFGTRFQQLCRTADLGTLIGLYRGLPLFPFSEALDWQIGEGLRTSIQAVFEAIAHRNPVPTERFSEHRWNHMVLKALFIEASLEPIVGLDQRRNAALAATLVDHVHERRAAGRAVDPQVWRCIAPFVRNEVIDDVRPLAASKDLLDRFTAALCLAESPDPAAARLLEGLATERERILSGAVSWDNLAVSAHQISEQKAQVK